MHLGDIVNDLRTHFQTAENDAKTFLEQHLPALAGLAEHAASNPLVAAAMGAVHLSPTMLQALAETIGRVDAELAALQPPATEAAPAEQPAEPAAPAA